MRLRHPWLAAVLLPCCLTLAPNVAWAGSGHDHAQPPKASVVDSADEVDEDGLTPVQQAKLAAFSAAVEARDQDAASMRQAREAANLAAAVAVRAAERAAEANQVAAAAALASGAADLEAARMRATVNGFARQMASQGDGGTEALVALVLSGQPPAEVLRVAESSERTASTLTTALSDLVALTEDAQRASTRAAAAQAAATEAGERASRKARDASRMLTAARTRLATSKRALENMVSTDGVLAEAATLIEVPGCLVEDGQSIYPNGMLPAAILCEPTQAPGHRLRSDAARAFDSMARAYAADRGEKLCITDSYRSLAAQVKLKVAKPYLAATPGTSNHGWGVAIDMCGGIENFDTPQHRWMQTNGPLFGWNHPSWAQADGSKPEPWHWEFSPELAEEMRARLAAVAEHASPSRGKGKPAADGRGHGKGRHAAKAKGSGKSKGKSRARAAGAR